MWADFSRHDTRRCPDKFLCGLIFIILYYIYGEHTISNPKSQCNLIVSKYEKGVPNILLVICSTRLEEVITSKSYSALWYKIVVSTNHWVISSDPRDICFLVHSKSSSLIYSSWKVVFGSQFQALSFLLPLDPRCFCECQSENNTLQ